MAKTKITLREAQNLLDKILVELSPSCERIEIAGSVKRRKLYPGDIEAVCIAKHQLSMFADIQGESLLEIKLAMLLAQGRLLPGGKDGPLRKCYKIPSRPDLNFELWITTPEKWGYTVAVNTGNARFSKSLVTSQRFGGRMPPNMVVRGSRYCANGVPQDTPEESDVFDICGGFWVEPWDRTDQAVRDFSNRLAGHL